MGKKRHTPEQIITALREAEVSLARGKSVKLISRELGITGSSEPDAGIREELARIERAILQGAVQILEEFGGLQAAMKRSVVLEKQVHRQPEPGSIRRASTWRTVRLAGARYR